jgi:hypothetical protein
MHLRGVVDVTIEPLKDRYLVDLVCLVYLGKQD